MSNYKQITTDPEAFNLVESLVLSWFNRGDERISVKHAIEEIRRDYDLTINNSSSTDFADRLLASHPELKSAIETRKRANRRGNLIKSPHPDIALLAAAFEHRGNLEFISIKVRDIDGLETTINLKSLRALFGQG